ncbi:MAG: hypothetical protein ACD_78C00195G0002 [uncultured bacterium (gcode 4)]|uniref:Uncharacterized protein n=1 Tax=uncultured bacterium (gcode 4) TaxID=1234023 RepID=K1XI30_9BACT|nr:MAG: hypothetical protein ACD_78C00195G0002 [uncultured bacterium (gcode 4)]
MELFYRGKFSITLEESNGINRIGCKIVPTESLIDDWKGVFPFTTGHIIIRMILGCRINLEMEVIPVRIPRIPHLPDNLAHFDRSFLGEDLGEMCIIGINISPIGKAVLDRDSIPPPILPRSRNYFSISDRTNRCPESCRDIDP